ARRAAPDLRHRHRGRGGTVLTPPCAPASPASALACRKAPRSRGNPFLPACAGQKFLPPGSLALSRFSRRATVGACENRSAAPAAPSLLRPLDALGAAAPWGQNLAPN